MYRFSPVTHAIARFFLRPWLVLCLTGSVVAVLHLAEKQWAHLPFVVNCLLVIALVSFTVTRKPVFSLYTAGALTVLICLVSTAKYRMKGFSFHVFDIFFTGTDSAATRFLLLEYANLIIPVIALAVIGTLILVMVARSENQCNVRLSNRLLALLVVIAVLPVSYPLNASQPRYFHYLGGFDASSFFVSLMDLRYLSRETELSERLNTLPRQPELSNEVVCKAPEESPDVFFVLGESQIDPAMFPQLTGNRAFAGLYQSFDGANRKLHVETFGGGTWVSHLSLMTGLSTADFGAQSPFLTVLLEGKVGGSVPDTLARCGYRTVAILPMDNSFVNEGPFLSSIGFQEVLDRDDIGATQYRHRDSFYFAAAERLIEEHRRTDKRPLFLAMQTMFPHSPYIDTLTADMEPKGVVFADEPELNEYLRRLLVSRKDLEGFLERRAMTPTERGSLVLDYGDHQSFATKRLVDEMSGGEALTDFSSIAYQTYYALHAFGYSPGAAGPGMDSLDIAFLAPSFFEWGRLPTTPMFGSLLELRDRCHGRFFRCADRDAVDRHLKGRADAGLLELF